MEEKNLNEAQAAEQTASQEVNEFGALKAENEQLKRNLEDLEASYKALDADNDKLINKLKDTEKSVDWNRKQYIEFMNQRDILKKALEEVCKRQNVSKAEMYEVIMTANDIDLDTAIAKLGKNL